jgi:S1-C subfamily serine protease
MFSSTTSFCWLAISSLLLATAPAQADKLSKVEISKRGKAATALVEIRPARATGTCFCVHPSGLFVTNEHVINRPGAQEIVIVLDSSLKTQRVLPARVVRRDKELDLALLRAEGARDLPALPLGSADDLTELMTLYTFGFPLGLLLSPDRKEYPAISVNASGLTSLRRKNGELYRLEMDAALNPGHSGSPVLDDEARVVGVVVNAIRGTASIIQAIPVNQLAKFLAAPDFQFTPPKLTRANLHEPTSFQVKAVSPVPASDPVEVELALGEERRLKMERKDGVYSARAIPVPGQGPRLLEITASFAKGSITGSVRDREIKVGDRSMALGSLSKLEFHPHPHAVPSDGQSLQGPITGLEAVPVTVGDQQVEMNLGKAATIQITAPQEPLEVVCTFIASRSGKEIGRLRVSVPVEGARSVARADPARAAIRPPALGEEKTVKRLPGTVADVQIGGAGRYLILQLPKLHQLAVFDVNEAWVTHYLPAADDNARFAAGLDKVVIGLPRKGVLERWSLTSWQRELAVASPIKGDIRSVAMGSASDGPLTVNGRFLDLRSFQLLPIKYPENAENGWESDTQVFASADGTTFGAWGSTSSRSVWVLQGSEVKSFGGPEDLGHVVPGPDGHVIFTSQGLFTNQLQPMAPKERNVGFCLPAVQGSFFVSLTPNTPDGKGGTLSLHLLGNDRPLAKLDHFHNLVFDGWGRDPLGPHKRFFFIPQAKLLIILPQTNDQLILHRFDVDALLENSGIDYLLVTSQPPTSALREGTYTYQLTVKSKKGGIKYALDSGPEGMEISETGLVRWPVPADAKDEQAVVITVRDAAGQEAFHTFTIKIARE